MINLDYTIFIQFFQLLILLILLNVFLFRPVLGHLAKRRSVIRALAQEAEGKKGEAESLGRTYDEDLEENKLPILAQKETALKEAHAASTKIVEEARTSLAEELLRMRDAVKAEGRKTLDALIGESDRLASEVAGKITGRRV
jgi:F-type H+-transporting ATPase subunit b